MLSDRYTIVIANRTTGVVRRFTLSLRPAILAVLGLFSLPVLIGLGARWSATAELEFLREANALLRQENASFRSATGELTGQITELQTAIEQLSEAGRLDPATRTAMSRLPALVRSQARGGSDTEHARALLAATLRSPEDTFGVLKGVLGTLERHLNVVRVEIEHRSEVARATPSIWPALGWLTSNFGMRSDPFTGRPASHLGVDISAGRGDPVYATANGRVVSAGWSGEYGNLVVVEHNFGLTTRYAHLSRVAVRPGDEVSRGDIVGYVGATGRATSAHLHYEVWADGRPVNPLRLLAGQRQP
ncbi:MAG TPA: M23 family metallopeptidase [Vicinamibacterales bacterium]